MKLHGLMEYNGITFVGCFLGYVMIINDMHSMLKTIYIYSQWIGPKGFLQARAPAIPVSEE
jgi:hypothetical protein